MCTMWCMNTEIMSESARSLNKQLKYGIMTKERVIPEIRFTDDEFQCHFAI